MNEWKKAKKLVEYREPKPNTHEWEYVGRTPQGGLSGGDDIHKCKLCGKSNLHEGWNGFCLEAGKKGQVEAILVGWDENGRERIERAVIGEHVIVKDVDGVRVVAVKLFRQNYELVDSEKKGEAEK